MKNYYDVLEIAKFENEQTVILSAYQTLTSSFETQIAQSGGMNTLVASDLKKQLIELNEAFLVLQDKMLKVEYDKALYSDNFAPIESRIHKKRIEARKFVQSRFPKPKKPNVWKIVGVSFLVLMVIGLVGRCVGSIVGSFSPAATELGAFTPDSSWQRYDFYNSFSISMPPTMELRNADDDYTKLLLNNGLSANEESIVFQQKGLSDTTQDARNTYCRVILTHYNCFPGATPRYYESIKLTSQDVEDLKKLVDAELAGADYIDPPTFRCVKFGNINAVEATYKRTGLGTPVSCKWYLLFNYDEFVKMVIAYRDCDHTIWKKDLENVIKTFKW